ncbi:hypothetical protein K439DRAFT_1660465 [Ramaria rubella]|nr:hypothetical protein K439DRAFT_1660465 [Ramaria rubella]
MDMRVLGEFACWGLHLSRAILHREVSGVGLGQTRMGMEGILARRGLARENHDVDLGPSRLGWTWNYGVEAVVGEQGFPRFVLSYLALLGRRFRAVRRLCVVALRRECAYQWTGGEVDLLSLDVRCLPNWNEAKTYAREWNAPVNNLWASRMKGLIMIKLLSDRSSSRGAWQCWRGSETRPSTFGT